MAITIYRFCPRLPSYVRTFWMPLNRDFFPSSIWSKRSICSKIQVRVHRPYEKGDEIEAIESFIFSAWSQSLLALDSIQIMLKT